MTAQRCIIGRLIVSLVGCIVLAGSVILWQETTSLQFTHLSMQQEDGSTIPFKHPLWLTTPDSALVTVHGTIELPDPPPTMFRMRHYSGLEELRVNDHVIPSDRYQEIFDLSGAVQAGTNTMSVWMKNKSTDFLFHSFSLTESTMSKRVLSTGALLLVLMIISMYAGCRTTWDCNRSSAGMLVIGIVLRLLYVFATPSWSHSYDWLGHREYITHMLHTWSIPAAQAGWETFQPPLYYFLCAGMLRLESLLFGVQYLEHLQALSLVLSVVTLIIAWRIGEENVEGKTQKLMFLGIVATFPGLIYFSSQITNDGLMTMLTFAWFLVLLRWHRSPSWQMWTLASAIVGVTLLTKSTGVLLVPIQALTAISVHHRSWKQTILRWCSLLLVLGVIAGWLLFLRFVVQGETSIVGNIHKLSEKTLMENTAQNLLLFSPFHILRFPFVNEVTFTTTRTQYFLEYFLRASLFGSFAFPQILQVCMLLLISAETMLLLLIAGIAGILKRWRSDAPMFWCLLILFAGVIAFRLTYPMTSNQHFRFVPLIVAPVAYFVVWGTRAIPKLQELTKISVLVFIALCASFIIGIFVTS